MNTLAGRFLKVRSILGCTQEKLAKHLMLNRSFLAQVETGIRNPSDQTLLLLEKEFGISKNWIETGEGFIFVDSEKALQAFKQAKTFDVEEIYYILSKIQDIYSKFSEYSVNEDITLKLYKIISENFEINGSENMNVSKMLSELTKYIVNSEFKVSDKLKNDLQSFIHEIGIYVFTAAVLYEKYKLTPVESIYVDLKAIKNIKTPVDFVEKLVVEGGRVKLHHLGKFILEFIGKGYIEFEREKLFGFASTALNIKDDESKEILDYEIFYSTIDKAASIKQKNITLSLTLEEFHSLRACFEKLRENTELWQWLQACYIEKYGFV